MKKKAIAIASILAMLGIWEIASLAAGNAIILPSPVDVLVSLTGLFSFPRFYEALLATTLRGITAFALSFAAGALVGIPAGLDERFAHFVSPLLTVIRATPVLAIILLALIWFSPDAVPVFSAFLMAFPVVEANISEGVKAIDSGLLKMTRVYGVKQRDVLLRVRIPLMFPHIVSAASNSLGLSWKVVVAGEVLSQPIRALGTGMQNARIMLETSEVLAWATVAVVLCGITEAAFNSIKRRLTRAIS